MSLDDGLGIVLDTLREGFDGEITEKNIEIAIINYDGFKSMTQDELKIFIKS